MGSRHGASEQVPEQIGQLTELRELQLSGIAIDGLPMTMSSLRQLTRWGAAWCHALAGQR